MSFAASTLYQLATARRSSQRHTTSPTCPSTGSCRWPVEEAPEDEPYLRRVFSSAAQIGAGIGRWSGLPREGRADHRRQARGRAVGGSRRPPLDARAAAGRRALPDECGYYPPAPIRRGPGLLVAVLWWTRADRRKPTRLGPPAIETPAAKARVMRWRPAARPAPGRVIDSLGDTTRLDALDAYQGRVLTPFGLASATGSTRWTSAVPSPTRTTVSPAGCSSSRRPTSALPPSDTGGSRWVRTGVANRCCPVTRPCHAYDAPTPGRRPLSTTTSSLGGPVVAGLARAGLLRCARAVTWPPTEPSAREPEQPFRGCAPRPQALLQAESSWTSAAVTATCRQAYWTRSCWPVAHEGPFWVQMGAPPWRVPTPSASSAGCAPGPPSTSSSATAAIVLPPGLRPDCGPTKPVPCCDCRLPRRRHPEPLGRGEPDRGLPFPHRPETAPPGGAGPSGGNPRTTASCPTG